MNYLPFCGYWFYGASGGTERASYTSSWGLLIDAPEATVSSGSIREILRMGGKWTINNIVKKFKMI